MSIASEITRLGSLRDTIRRKLISAGIISNASAKLSECATAIDGMTVNSKVSKVLNTSTTSVAIPKGYHKEAGTVSISTQEKTQAVTSGTVTVSPDSGKVLKKVTVNGPTSYADTTQFASAITQDDENTYFGVPNAGYYNTGSKIAAKNSNLSNYIKAEVLYNGAGGTINLTIPDEFKNGIIIVQASHDNRGTYTCSINGKTPVYTYRGTEYLQSYFGMDVDVFQLSGDTSLILSCGGNGCTVTVINKKVKPTYISTEVSLNASKGEDYLCIYTRDYRGYMLISADGVSCSNLRSGFSSAEALYGVYGTWYCHNCATVCAMKDTTVTIEGDLVLWLKI